MPLSEVKDDVFSKEILGKGIAIKPTEGKLFAPSDGTITMTYKTGHAVGMKTNNGTELLFHIGINTVKLNGKYFKVVVKEGQKVKKGDVLVNFDLDSIKLAGFDPITVMIITNTNGQKINLPKVN